MKYRVHAYLTVRVPFDVEAGSQTEAIAKARELVDDDTFRIAEAEYAEEISGYLVDEEGDPDYQRTRTYDRRGRQERSPLIDALQKALATPAPKKPN